MVDDLPGMDEVWKKIDSIGCVDGMISVIGTRGMSKRGTSSEWLYALSAATLISHYGYQGIGMGDLEVNCERQLRKITSLRKIEAYRMIEVIDNLSKGDVLDRVVAMVVAGILYGLREDVREISLGDVMGDLRRHRQEPSVN